jgi:uncharacterized heparinase superfamily protein
LLNERRELRQPSDWNDPAATRLWQYNLHYHDGLRDSATPASLKNTFVKRWLAENPVGFGRGWEPYSISARLVNWIAWLFADRPSLDEREILQSMAVQARYLAPRFEFHLMGNHVLTNAKGLTFAGLFFDGPEAESWLRQGMKVLRTEIREQFLPDGGHFELSPTYHALLTEDLLDVINMSRWAGKPYPAEWDSVAAAAVQWLNVMTRGDGRQPLFNDATYGTSAPPRDIAEYAARLGLKGADPLVDGLTYLEPSGYFRFETATYSVFGDVGQVGPDYIPGHAHCDMLNFELCIGKDPLVVDTGVSTYDSGQQRTSERSTAAHNTVQLGALEQSEMWGAFRVGRRATIGDVRVGRDFVEASHDGFAVAGCEHRRRFAFEPSRITIHDEVVRKRPEPLVATARFHFAPGVRLERTTAGVRAGRVEIAFEGAKAIEEQRYRYAPTFNVTHDAPLLSVEFETELTTRFVLR